MSLIVINFLLLFLSAFFSASETALFSIPRERILGYKDSPKLSGRYIYKLLTDGQRTLMVILVGNLAVNITVVGTINSLVKNLFPESGLWFTFIVATGMILLFGEIVPKNLAVRNGNVVAHLSAPLLFNFKRLIKPIVVIMEKINMTILASFSRYLRQPSPFITMQELATELEESKEDNVISEEEFGLLSKVLQSMDISIASALIHRSELLYLKSDATCEEAISLMGSNDAWFCVVGDDDTGRLKSFLFIEDLLEASPRKIVSKYLIEAVYVSGTLNLSEVTLMMKSSNIRAIAVHDEFGDLQGVLTLNSGLRRILMIEDNSEFPVQYVGDFKGLEQLEDIPQWIPVSLKEESFKYKTLNGLITGHLGRIPVKGERFAIDDYIFYIIGSSKRKIDSIRIVKGNSNVS